MLAGLFGDINGAAHEFSDVPRPTVNICPRLVEKLPRFFNALNAPYSNRLTFYGVYHPQLENGVKLNVVGDILQALDGNPSTNGRTVLSRLSGDVVRFPSLITLLATSYVVGKPSRRMGGTPVSRKYAPVLSERRGWLIILANARSLSHIAMTGERSGVACNLGTGTRTPEQVATGGQGDIIRRKATARARWKEGE
ncbi:hypothetical protein PoMZ_00038 [Pyricularia oryzae]|uniref:Uncharacterized protein n=1 Tax=Pyricularia oryzae TaxID=318829 RepID=A0A4P7N3C2_PYROR|nr:hypothetical protein PoMZ_00038 [Pyricularia oryzae]